MTSSSRLIHIAIFASGSGSNAEQILSYFSDHDSIRVSLIVSNNRKAGILQRAKRHGIPVEILDRAQSRDGNYILGCLKDYRIDFVVLAGYLKLIPKELTEAFRWRMLNIHPALLPKFGGKGMYGHHVHEAVIANQEHHSGMTIHYVNSVYDEGKHIFQAQCVINPEDTADSVAQKVLRLEHIYFAPIIEQVIFSQEWAVA